MNFSNMKLANKMIVFIATLSILLITSLLFVHNKAAVLAENVNQTKNESVKFAMIAKDMQQDVIAVQQWLTDISATRGLDGLNDGFDEAKLAYDSFIKGLNSFKSMYQAENNTAELRKIQVLNERFDNWYQTGIKMANGYIANGPAEGNKLMGEFDTSAVELDTVLEPFVGSQLKEAHSKLDSISELSASLNSFLTITFISIILFVMLFGWLITSNVVKSVKALCSVMTKVAQSGELNHRVKVYGNDEVGIMADSFNNLLASVEHGIHEANTVVTAIAKGQFNRRINVNLNGDLNILKNGVNQSAEAVDFMMHELGKVMDAMHEGEFTVKMSDKVEGEFRNRVNSALASIQYIISDINQVMKSMADGDFSSRVSATANGDLDTMKKNINQSLTQVQTAIDAFDKIMENLAKGDLTAQLPSGSLKGQFHDLKNSLNYTASKMREVVNFSTVSAQNIQHAAADVSDQASSFSESVQKQAAALEETSASMTHINGIVQENMKQAQNVKTEVLDVKSKADESSQVMKDTIDAMNAIQESSHKIVEIVTLIDSIAFQTNLLALNAAVEAARAGDHGRGFAVVAGEVRNLAQKSAEAAKDIKGLIDETTTRVNQGSELAKRSGDVLGAITENISSIVTKITHIAEASSDQARNVSEVNLSIAQVDKGTQENAVIIDETTQASISMRSQAEDLNEHLSFFNTGGGQKSQNNALALTKK